VDQKVLLFLVVLALVGIAYYVRFKPHRSQSATTTSEPAKADSKPAKSTRCADNCLRIRVKCTASCGMDRPCLNACDHGRESCEAACP
jgi:hypothetical protein